MASLYVHIPFCARKCAYCDFTSYAGRERDTARYLRALTTEMDVARGEFGALHFDTMFIGGGTPSLLSGAQLQRLMDAARARFTFAPDAEITIEANPGTISREKLESYLAAGVNRISLGVQAFQNALLRALGRIHTASQSKEAMGLVRLAGFTNINFDLMYALPGQAEADWAQTLERTIELNPTHLSCYSLIPEPGTPLFNDAQSGALVVPDEAASAAMQDMTVDMLKSAGYQHYEISNYSKPGFACRHNMNYWRRGDYLGVGCAAHSLIDEVRYENTDSLDEYLSGVTRAATLPIPPGEAREEALMLGLRTSEGIDLAAYTRRFGENLMTARADVIRRLLGNGLARVEAGRLFLIDRGMFVQNAILLKLL